MMTDARSHERTTRDLPHRGGQQGWDIIPETEKANPVGDPETRGLLLERLQQLSPPCDRGVKMGE